MLAAIDIGNTNIVIGVFDDDELVTRFRISTRPFATTDETALVMEGLLAMKGLSCGQIDAVCLASVVPSLTDVFAQIARERCDSEPVVVGPGVRTGISIEYENPKEVGADRVVNAVAAHGQFNTNLVIVDFGTATTFDAVTAKGQYLGGVIVPGVRVSMEALFARTAKLPKVEIARPRSVIGKNTIESIQSGAYYGYLTMVEGLVERMAAEMVGPTTVVATGGLAALLCGDSSLIDVIDPDLTLFGLKKIWELNQ